MGLFQYQDVTEPVFTAGELITEDKWHFPWSEPVKQKISPLLAVALMVSGGVLVEAPPFQEQVTESRWHQPWSEPVRLKIDYRLAIALDAPAYAVPVLPPILEDDWHYPLSIPVRILPRAAWFQPFTSDPSVIPTSRIESDWQYPWSEPVRFKLRAAYFTPFTSDPSVIPTARIEADWQYPWSEPVRFKPRAAFFQPFTDDTVLFPVNSAESLWHQPWSIPASLEKVGLKTHLQQTLAWYPRIVVGTTITVTFQGLETGDSLLGGIASFNPPVTVNVGIIDIAPRSAQVGVIETQQVSGIVGNVTSQPTSQSGTVTPLSTAARVSIRTV